MKKSAGFTLIELMVTLAVAIILLAVGIPMFSQMQANARITGQTNALVSAIALARAEAVGKRVPAVICPKANTAPNNFNCGGAGDWVNGWEVFLDEGGVDGAYDAGTDTVIRVFESVPAQSQVQPTNFVALRYLMEGVLDEDVLGNPNDPAAFRISHADARSFHNCVSINRVGQVRTEKIVTTAACP